MNKILSLCLMLMLAGCGSAPTRLYSLQPVTPGGARLSYDGPPIRVAAVHFPSDMDRIEIVTERGDGALSINDNDHWAAPLSKLAQQTLSADLLSRLPAGKVAFPRLPTTAAVAELRVDLLRVPPGGGGGMAASWQLELDPHTERSGIINLPDGLRSGSADQVVHSLDALLGHLADQLAAQLPAAQTP